MTQRQAPKYQASQSNPVRPTWPRAVRSAYAFALVLLALMRQRRGTVDAQLNHTYQVEDPWNYGSASVKRRFNRELRLIDSASAQIRVESALEVGCGEGHFTELLAPRCRSLLAVDINEVALERARRRYADLSGVSLRTWDLRVDSPPGLFDLVVATSVLEFFHRPWELRRARSTLAACVRPGGWLLVGNVSQHEIVENAWWDRYLLRGARHVNEFVSRHPELRLVQSTGGDGYLEVMLTKPGGESPS